METSSNSTVELFNNLIGIKFQLYNSLFTALPFHRVEKTGVLLSMFLLHCEERYNKKNSPVHIVDIFLKQYTNYKTEKEKIDLLFRFVQYTERQVVLFDALEDAAFDQLHQMQGAGTLSHLLSEVKNSRLEPELLKKLKDFSVRPVLTAHPTQFYPGEVLGIIHDLSSALIKDDASRINAYLRQLGKTPFLKKEKPTPYDEAISLIWYLENIFYQAAGKIAYALKTNLADAGPGTHHVIRMGFWPGGDRDGNPFVNVDITLKVAEQLRGAILKCYYLDVRKLKHRLTFKGVEELVDKLENNIYNNLFIPAHKLDITQDDILKSLLQIRTILINDHNSLFLQLVDEFISKVELFGLYFASLDIRQDSSVHKPMMEYIAKQSDVLPDNYKDLGEQEKIDAILQINRSVDPDSLKDKLYRDTLQTIRAVKTIQKSNGEEGCNRYIISHATSPLDLIEPYGFFLMSGWKKNNLPIDIIPLFETIEDLKNASGVMTALYENKTYRAHLKNRNNTQTIMLGFSDGTKDGGYLMANWSIYQAKEQLTEASRKYGLEVVFFDGRGGPPARGGGKTHQFYASMGNRISSKEIQLTVQGQTISSNFGTVDSARFNLEQLIHAGMSNDLFPGRSNALSPDEESVFQALAEESFGVFQELKNNPLFLEYLSYASPLRYYGKTNIGSRPSKRKSNTKLNLNDLRAVPYVGSWSQLKQNVSGYYGVGSALEKLDECGEWPAVEHLYKQSIFFKALLDNCEMSMKKCFFPLTEYLSSHPQFGVIWKMIYHEFEKTKRYILKLTGNSELMESYPVDKLSIQMRERIVLPLLTIQQYALTQIRETGEARQDSPDLKSSYEKLAMRCSFGIINAARNSA
ncbi:MAG TPA: phosphoenolpyruvate carboxylase [Chitinophagaceae bacterium]|nr:phosphoenolpyruvate carboxylase [Chitinophagaceae bacterium]